MEIQPEEGNRNLHRYYWFHGIVHSGKAVQGTPPEETEGDVRGGSQVRLQAFQEIMGA